MRIFEFEVFWYTFWPSYYGLMYALAFIYGFWAIKKTQRYSEWERESLFLYIFLWVILGGRLWYILFYDLWAYLAEPTALFKIWEWGMSFHGGLIGFTLASYFFAKKYKRSFLELMDDLALIVPVWLFLWRIGNYINKELLWFPYEGFLAVKTAQGSFFPSPLVEALLEWLLIFIILKQVNKNKKFLWHIATLFLIWYGIFRSFVEIFIRTPDPQIWYYFWFITQWSILSFVMIIAWLILYRYLNTRSYAS